MHYNSYHVHMISVTETERYFYLLKDFSYFTEHKARSSNSTISYFFPLKSEDVARKGFTLVTEEI